MLIENRYSNHIKLILFFITPILYLIYFPRPYFLSRWYDAEANFIANISSFYSDGFVVDFLHPDTFIIYIGTIFIKLIGNESDIEKLIINLRTFYTYFNLIIIFLSLRYILKYQIDSILLFCSFLLLIPNISNFVGFLSPQESLIGIGTLLVSISIKLFDSYRKYSFFYGLILGIGVSVKFTFILLFFPFFLTLLFKFFSSKNNILYFKIFTIIFLTFIISFFVFAFPILPMLPIYITQWVSAEKLYLFLFNNSFIITFIIIFILLIIYLLSILVLSLFKDSSFMELYFYISILFIFLFFFNFAFSFIKYDFLIQAASSRSRNFAPLICLIIILCNTKKLKLSFRLQILIFLIFLSSSFLKAFNNYNLYAYSNFINNSFEDYINYQSENNNNIAFHPSSYFASKDYFLSWSDYRYGDRINMYDDQHFNLPFKLNKNKIKIDIFNINHFNTNIEKRLGYKYLEKILNLNILPEVHKKIIRNNLYFLQNKELCLKPYDSYKVKDKFIILIPNELTYLSTNINSLKEIDFNSQTYVNEIMNKLKTECNFNVNLKNEYIDQLKVYVIYVRT